MFTPSDWISIAVFAVAALATVGGAVVASRGGRREDGDLTDFKLHVAQTYLPREEFDRRADHRDAEMADLRSELREGFDRYRSEIERDLALFMERLGRPS